MLYTMYCSFCRYPRQLAKREQEEAQAAAVIALTLRMPLLQRDGRRDHIGYPTSSSRSTGVATSLLASSDKVKA